MGWYDRKVRRVRDLSCGDTRIFLELEVRRIDCRRCGKVKRGAAEIGKPRLELGIGERRVDCLTELLDYFGGRIPFGGAASGRPVRDDLGHPGSLPPIYLG